MQSPALRSAIEAVNLAQGQLLARQSEDGAWMDFRLPPGPSDAWITAFVGWALLREPMAVPATEGGIAAASAFMHRIRRPGGWGYNMNASCDADSTAWAIRFLQAAAAVGDLPVVDLLAPYLGPDGRARTFSSEERFGSWAAPHDEVTPVVGLALLETDADRRLVAQIRAAVVESWKPASAWAHFWWDTPSYALAQNFEFLRRTGGLGPALARSTDLVADDEAASTFACSQLLAAASLADDHRRHRLLERLITLQDREGTWPASAALRVPEQRAPWFFTVHTDERQVHGTAAAVAALKIFLGREVARAARRNHALPL